MNLSDFNFPFEPTLVAKHPVHPRDHARLLVLNRHQGQIADRQVHDLPDILRSGDLLVVNDTKVIPARLLGKKVPSGGRIELLFVQRIDATHAEVLINGRVGVGQLVEFQGSRQARVVEKQSSRTVIHWLGPGTLQTYLQQHGEMPLPPYFKREPTMQDREDYQTMFAEVEGAVASPTASLHFTPRLLQALENKGIHCGTVTLHVGPGTFQPVKTEVAGTGLQPAPCELADPHPGQPSCDHVRGILGPLVLGPVFGVIADTKRAFHVHTFRADEQGNQKRKDRHRRNRQCHDTAR